MVSATSNNITDSGRFDAGSLVNGIFTDFATLLALFGDVVKKQFRATSIGWGDDILLALGPIGVMTVLVSAIRVCGYQFMKSIIGRCAISNKLYIGQVLIFVQEPENHLTTKRSIFFFRLLPASTRSGMDSKSFAKVEAHRQKNMFTPLAKRLTASHLFLVGGTYSLP
jgi:hypothetical protein